MQTLAPIPEMLSVSPFGMTIYNDYSYLPKKAKTESIPMPRNNDTNGILSPSAKKNLRNCIGYLILRTQKKHKSLKNPFPNISKKIGFMTLTLPGKQKHSDQEIKSSCLNQFLIEINTIYKIEEYVWRAEKQKNGNIHFHLLINKFIKHEDIKKRWNRIINKLGYVKEYQDKHKNLTFREYCQLYPTQEKNGHRIVDRVRQYENGKATSWSQPNSTDIKNLKHVKNAGRYISKYVSKVVSDTPVIKAQRNKAAQADELSKLYEQAKLEELIRAEAQKLKIEGRLWFASESLTKIKNLKFELTPELKEELSLFISWSHAKELKTDFCYWYNRGVENLCSFARSKLSQLAINYIEFSV